MGYERRKEVLHNAIRGWVNYFKYAYAKTHLQAMDEWLRCRIDYSGINVPLVAVCNVPPVAQCNVPPQKWLQ